MKIKHAITALTFMSFLFININLVQAAPLYYTFEGIIDNFGSDPVGEASNAGLGRFQPVMYTLKVDFEEPGFKKPSSDNNIEMLEDQSGVFYGMRYTTDYFYSSLISSNHPTLSPIISLPNDYFIINNLGSSVTWENGTASGQVIVGSRLTIQSQHQTVQDWDIGTTLKGFYQYGDERIGEDSIFRSNLELISINTTIVPLPSSILFFLSGVISLILFSKKNNSGNA